MVAQITTRIMETDHDPTTTNMLQARQRGTGVSGGAETIATFDFFSSKTYGRKAYSRDHLLSYKIDQTNCFGQLEHLCVDRAIRQDHPAMAPMRLWAHSQTSQVVQGAAGHSTQTRGAQQGGVAGSF